MSDTDTKPPKPPDAPDDPALAAIRGQILALPQIQVRQANAVIESMRQFRGLFGDEVMGLVLTLVQAEVEWDRQQREAK